MENLQKEIKRKLNIEQPGNVTIIQTIMAKRINLRDILRIAPANSEFCTLSIPRI